MDQSTVPNALELSDEEWLARGGVLPAPETSAEDSATPATDPDTDTEEDVATGDAATDADTAEGDAAATAADADTADADTADADADAADGEDEQTAADDDSADAKASADSDKTEPENTEEEIDYKAEYARLTAPFRANGKEMQVKNVDEAIQLMQMGANYNRKMAALKPHLKILKMLENQQLLDENKLSFLIDLDKKNPEAIKKLIKDSGLDPLELTTNEASEYRPGTYTVHDQEIELDQVLEEIQDTPSYARTLDLVSNKWDTASKQVLAQYPQLLKVINDHVASGIYDIISRELERERAFGRLQGLSDIEAYRQVGDAIHARGGFNHLVQSKATTPPAPAVKVVTPAPKGEDAAVRNKRRAAAPARATPAPNTPAAEFNPLALSDEEFMKQFNPNLM